MYVLHGAFSALDATTVANFRLVATIRPYFSLNLTACLPP